MKTSQGDVILADFPFSSGRARKMRPALVVQRDELNAALPDTVLAMISSQVQAVIPPYHVLIDPADSSGAGSGLRRKSVIRCERVFALDQQFVLARIGRCPAQTMETVRDALRRVFDI